MDSLYCHKLLSSTFSKDRVAPRGVATKQKHSGKLDPSQGERVDGEIAATDREINDLAGPKGYAAILYFSQIRLAVRRDAPANRWRLAEETTRVAP